MIPKVEGKHDDRDKEQIQQAWADHKIQLDAKIRHIENGISIHPRPAAFFWAPEVGFTMDGNVSSQMQMKWQAKLCQHTII